MIVDFTDYNNVGKLIAQNYSHEWKEVKEILENMPLHIKASDQAKIQGKPIFDPVGTNDSIKNSLVNKLWRPNIPIPQEYSFMGTDIDFGKNGIIIEVQFSNYPFLLNNILRCELFFKSRISLTGKPTACIFIITKAHMFPASNSTLYYEQGREQLNALFKHGVFSVPIRLIGLKSTKGTVSDVIWTEYSDPRYSRTIINRKKVTCHVVNGRSDNSRCCIQLK